MSLLSSLCRWGHLFEYCSPEYAALLKQRKPVEGLSAAVHMRKGSSSVDGTDRLLHPEDRVRSSLLFAVLDLTGWHFTLRQYADCKEHMVVLSSCAKGPTKQCTPLQQISWLS